MKQKYLIFSILLAAVFIIGLLFTMNLFKNDTPIDSKITKVTKNSSFIMADDKYCDVNLEYTFNDETKTYKTRLSGLDHNIGDNVKIYEYKGHIVTMSEYFLLVFLDFAIMLFSAIMLCFCIETRKEKRA